MQYVSRTRLLTLAFAASALGLTVTVQDSLNAQTSSLPPARVIDDGDKGYVADKFMKTTHPPAYGGDASYFKKSATATSNATWSFTGLDVGTYDVYATWAPTSGFSTATYSVVGAAGSFAAQKTVNQKTAPSTMERDGYKWEKIGAVTLTAKGGIGVFVAPAADGYAQADAVMIVGSTLTGTAQTAAPSAPRCGDTIVQTDEQCDDGNTVNTDACSNACKTPFCGDGITQPFSWQPEQCDDGNQSNEDACTIECKLPRCGDGFVRAGVEECDYGAYMSCTTSCKVPVCGDRKVEGFEYCDDGNASSGDGCSAQCVTEAPAGSDTQSVESVVLSCEGGVSYATVKYRKNHANCIYLKKNGQPFEAYNNLCDTAINTLLTKKVVVNANFLVATDDKVKACHPMITQIWGCTEEVTVTGTSCAPVAPVCGNNKKEGTEECDDGNQSNTDACLNTCKAARCNDGFIHGYPGFEECDDGNYEYRDSCSNSCKIQKCGNGIAEDFLGEQCDDNNTDNADGCTNACKKPVCGDGFVLKPSSNMSYPGREWCDDGNTANGDGCSSTCVTEAAARCGDGVKAASEQCDDGNTVNGDGCSPTCQTQAITVGCGNGTLDAGEICDNGTQNVSFLSSQQGLCTTQCRRSGINVCGNGTKEGTEGCDDGNSVDTDACRNICQLKTTCGNGVKETGEQCDDGNTNNNDACTAACSNARCLDGIVWTNVESCDDGNAINGDACSTVCTFTPVCGNARQDYGEQCDDGNRVDTDSCKNNCTTPGTASVPPPATPQIPASCGNWVFDAGEQCDMGGVRTPIPNTSLCCTIACGVESCGTTTPAAAVCGNGIPQTGEQCDDGNQIDTDACRNNCTTNTATVAGAALTIRNVDAAQATWKMVKSSTATAMRFTATAGAQNVVLNDLLFKATEGNIQTGFYVTLRETRPGDVAGTYSPGRYWHGELQNGRFLVSTSDSPLTIPANATKTFELDLYTQHGEMYGPAAFNPPHGPIQINFDTLTPNYVHASTNATALANVATNGTCDATNCQIAVFTGPTIVNDYHNAGNLTVTGEQGAASSTVNAGTESPVVLRVKMKMTDEDAAIDIPTFRVQGAQAVQELTLKIDGVAVTSATLQPCRNLAPYSQQELGAQGAAGNGMWQFWNFGHVVESTTEYCALFNDFPHILKRGVESVMEVRAKIKPRSSAWATGTKIRVTMVQDEHYFYVSGETSMLPMRPMNSVAAGGNLTYAGVLTSNEHTAQ